MNMLGLVGGIGPESTLEYYRQIVAAYREAAGNEYPHFLVNSISLHRMVSWINAGQWPEVTEYLLGELHALERAGARFGALAANTPHVIFDDLQRRSPFPLVSIVEATRDATRAAGLQRVGLFGTRFTMQGRFYPDVFASARIELIVPRPSEQDYVHDKYMSELIVGTFSRETRAGLIEIAERMRREEHIEALILGGTELPLILDDATEAGMPLLDTTRIHVQAIVRRMLE